MGCKPHLQRPNYLGVRQTNDKGVADMLRPRVAAGGQLFDTNDGKVRDYLQSIPGAENFKTKDFRTWNGTNTAIKTIAKMDAPTTEAEYKTARLIVGDAVSKHLGNTRTVALKSYIDPIVWKPWQNKIKK